VEVEEVPGGGGHLPSGGDEVNLVRGNRRRQGLEVSGPDGVEMALQRLAEGLRHATVDLARRAPA
jgi:hypothetical protein